MVYSLFDVLRVPFPFTDRTASIRRPAVVLSDNAAFNTPAGHSVLAMVTSAKHTRWPLDTVLEDLDAAGLPAASVVRCKLFTLDHRLIIDRLGRLSPEDVDRVTRNLQRVFPWCAPGGRV